MPRVIGGSYCATCVGMLPGQHDASEMHVLGCNDRVAWINHMPQAGCPSASSSTIVHMQLPMPQEHNHTL